MNNIFQSSWMEAFLSGNHQLVLILLADGFDDLVVLSFVKNLRRASIPVKLLGFSKRQVRSTNGIQVHPDLSLNNLGDIGSGSLLIIPDGSQIEARILIDPRIQDLIGKILYAEGYVLAGEEVVNLINQFLVMSSNQLIIWP